MVVHIRKVFVELYSLAVYDETLILQQMEPPTFHGVSPILSTAPTNQFTRKDSRKGSYQVNSKHMLQLISYVEMHV